MPICVGQFILGVCSLPQTAVMITTIPGVIEGVDIAGDRLKGAVSIFRRSMPAAPEQQFERAQSTYSD